MVDNDARMINLLTDIRRITDKCRKEAELAWSLAVTKEQQAQESVAEISRRDAETAWDRAVTREDIAKAQEVHENKSRLLYDIVNMVASVEFKVARIKQIFDIDLDLEAVPATWPTSSSTSSSSPSSTSKAASGKSKLPQPLSFTSPAKCRRILADASLTFGL